MKKINEIAKAHFDWIESRGWHNSTNLESVGLIFSEIGESIEEYYRKVSYNENLNLEIADIYLRCMDLAVKNCIDLDKSREQFDEDINLYVYGSSIFEKLAYLTVPCAKLINTTRYSVLPPEFEYNLIYLMLCVEEICEKHNIDLFKTIENKMEINFKKDHKNRIK